MAFCFGFETIEDYREQYVRDIAYVHLEIRDEIFTKTIEMHSFRIFDKRKHRAFSLFYKAFKFHSPVQNSSSFALAIRRAVRIFLSGPLYFFTDFCSLLSLVHFIKSYKQLFKQLQLIFLCVFQWKGTNFSPRWMLKKGNLRYATIILFVHSHCRVWTQRSLQ